MIHGILSAGRRDWASFLRESHRNREIRISVLSDPHKDANPRRRNGQRSEPEVKRADDDDDLYFSWVGNASMRRAAHPSRAPRGLRLEQSFFGEGDYLAAGDDQVIKDADVHGR
jgi:hypothetical protein